MSAQVLLTGGAGLLGAPLAKRLLADGWKVTVVDVAERPAMLAHQDLQYVRCDVNDPELAAQLGDATFSVVVHLAALSDVAASLHDPLAFHQVNVTGTLRMLELARHHKVPRFVLGSSALVHGIAQRTDERPRPSSPYAATKLAAEQFAQVYADLHGLQVTTLRFFPVHGPRSQHALRRLFEQVDAGGPVAVHGDDSTQVSLVHVDDAVDALMNVIERSEERGHRVLDIGGGAIGERALIHHVASALGRTVRLVERPVEESELPLFLPVNAPVEQGSASRTAVPLLDGLAASLAHYRAERP